MTTLAAAVKRKQWEAASLFLLLGVTEAAAALPPGAIEGLLEVLAGLEAEVEPRPRKGRRGGRR